MVTCGFNRSDYLGLGSRATCTSAGMLGFHRGQRIMDQIAAQPTDSEAAPPTSLGTGRGAGPAGPGLRVDSQSVQRSRSHARPRLRQYVRSRPGCCGDAPGALSRCGSSSLLDEWDYLPMREARPERFVISGGSRVQRPAARIERNGARHVPGRPFATLASTVHRLPVCDTRCSAGRIRFEPAAQVFDRPSVCRWLLDLEILVRILQRIGPAP